MKSLTGSGDGLPSPPNFLMVRSTIKKLQFILIKIKLLMKMYTGSGDGLPSLPIF